MPKMLAATDNEKQDDILFLMFAGVFFDQNRLQNILSRAVDLLPEKVCSVTFGYLGPVLLFLTIQ